MDQIEKLKRLSKAENKLRKAINTEHGYQQQMAEDTTQLFQPLTKQSEKASAEVQKAVENLEKVVITPENVIIQSALEKHNDPVFGLVPYKENYVFGIVPIIADIYENLRYDVIELSPDGVGVVGSPERHPISKPLMHALTRNARPQNAAVKKIFLNLVDLSVGQLLLDLKKQFLDEKLMNILESSVKFRELISKKYELYKKPLDVSTDVQSQGPEGDFLNEGFVQGEGQDLQRLLVLMGAANAGNVRSGMQEFTAILDEFLKNKRITKTQYEILMRRFKR